MSDSNLCVKILYSRYLDERRVAEEITGGNTSRKRKISEMSNQSDNIDDDREVVHKKTRSFDVFSRFSSIASMATTAISNAFGWIFRPTLRRGADLPITGHAIPDGALVLSTDVTTLKVGDNNCCASSSSSSKSQSIEIALRNSKLEKSRKLSRKSAAAEIQMTVSAVFRL